MKKSKFLTNYQKEKEKYNVGRKMRYRPLLPDPKYNGNPVHEFTHGKEIN